MSVGDKAASRRAEALLALQSKLKIIDDAKDVWTAKRAQINEDMGPVLKESIMGRERVARREENLEGTKERVGTRECHFRLGGDTRSTQGAAGRSQRPQIVP